MSRHCFVFLFFSTLTFAQLKVEYNKINKTYDTFGLSEMLSSTYLFTDGINSKFVSLKTINGKLEQSYNIADEEMQLRAERRNNNHPGDSLGCVLLKNIEKKSYNQRVLIDKKYFTIFQQRN